ncbi:MAG TPA: isochorismate synthase [Macellibacteroides fermentans]|uniref:isochorismate synthase n=1 Tax=Macellibacteroides fermentans TaxID=879969 RepID=UPI002BC0F7ED|nr:isochorismate synthase [Macellibacteroides fermentans]
MIPSEVTNFSGIDSLIHQQRSFALYLLPGNNEPTLVLQEGGDMGQLKSYTELNDKKGFVLAPFCLNESHPIVLIRADIVSVGWKSIAGVTSFQSSACSANKETVFMLDKEDLYYAYNKSFNVFIKPLREGIFEKLVLSRKVNIKKTSEFSPAKAFYNACRRYKRAFVYLCHSPQSGTWLGSTPELLLSGQFGHWNTVALAGTQPLIGNNLPDSWNDKNRKEQALVADYIKSQLASANIDVLEDGPFTVQAGDLAHLKTEFRFETADRRCLGNLVELLHPTPAICGLPRKEALQFIKENEGYDRSYYSGFIGMVDADGRNDIYVNLRCMNIGENDLTLFAGGGLLDSSDVDQEWEETNDKLQTMLAILK